MILYCLKTKLTLAHGVPWNLSFNDLHLMGDLVRCQAVLQRATHIQGTEWFTSLAALLAFGSQHDDRDDLLTPLFRWQSDHGHFGNLRTRRIS